MQANETPLQWMLQDIHKEENPNGSKQGYNKFGRFAISSSWTRLPDAQYAGMAVLQRSTGCEGLRCYNSLRGFNDGCASTPTRMQRKKANAAKSRGRLPYVRVA